MLIGHRAGLPLLVRVPFRSRLSSPASLAVLWVFRLGMVCSGCVAGASFRDGLYIGHDVALAGWIQLLSSPASDWHA
jgi:hypothetical protein